jgi:hypothetical protein
MSRYLGSATPVGGGSFCSKCDEIPDGGSAHSMDFTQDPGPLEFRRHAVDMTGTLNLMFRKLFRVLLVLCGLYLLYVAPFVLWVFGYVGIIGWFGILALIVASWIWSRPSAVQTRVSRRRASLLKSQRPGEDFYGAACETLAPSEVHLSSCSMIHDGLPVLALLTNRNIRSVQFTRAGLLGRKLTPVVSGSIAIPLHEIRAMSTAQKRIKGYSSKMLELSLVTVVGTHSFLAGIDGDSVEFGKACERAFQDKVGLEQSKMVGDSIGRLATLLNEGLITTEEFEHAKKGLVGKPNSHAEEVVGLLRQMHSLHLSGVLSASEFRLKKWDLLSKQ